LKYFKNTELANLYHVSEKSVRNWIEASQKGKLPLQLYTEKDRIYIANTPHNSVEIEKLVERGKKYKNSRSFKTISPLPSFYETYSTKQIIDIISNLTIHHELPLQYNYVNGGAEFWDQYAHRLATDYAPNVLKGTMRLIEWNLENFDRLIGNRKVNVVDLGPGNGLPVKELLSYLLKSKKLNRYIGVDISKEILKITERQLKDWFGNQIPFEGHIRDISVDRFDDLFADDYITDETKQPVNLVLMLSGTICNFRSPIHALYTINSSLGPEDLFVYTTKLDTPNTRRYFDLGIEAKPRPQDFLFHFLVDALGFQKSSYEIDQFFDEEKQARSISLRPLLDLAVEFQFPKGKRTVYLNKGEPILLWRYWHYNTPDVINQFNDANFNLMQMSKTTDQEYLLLVAQIETE
jgi:uncharacterized SAM-dependent methyltransferase